MKKSNLKILSLLMLVAIVVATVFSCKKTSFPPDPNDSVVVKREIVVSALDVFTKDSLTQFSVTIVSPSATTTQTSTGKTFVVKDPVAGNYKITISKTGYGEPEVLEFKLTVPTDPKASFSLPATALLTKSAPAVAVTGATGAVIAVKTNAEAPSSAPVANATVAPNTVFTLADGTKPATVSISVTNLPVNTSVAPVATIGGVNTLVVSNGLEIVNNQIPSQKLDLQPTGLVLSQPMTIDMYIGDKYPPTMSVAEKTARQNGLTLNYVRKDGTVEVVSPDRFSADRNTVYYKITHFSEWTLNNKDITFTLLSSTTLAPVNQTFNCAAPVPAGIKLTASVSYNAAVAWLMTGRFLPITYTHESPAFAGVAGSPANQATISWVGNAQTYSLVDKTPGFSSTTTVTIPAVGGNTATNFSVCHN
jgi:hypothetical protein